MLDTMHNILEKDGGVIVKNVDLSPLKGKSILITGATGLIGMNIVASLKALCKKSDGPKKIVCAVHSPILNLKESIFNFPEIEIASGDLSEGINFLNIYGAFDFIIHAAGYGQPGKFMSDPVKTLKLNTSTTLQLFDLLKPSGNFLFLSTSELYSGLDFSPHRETDIGNTNTYHQRGCYIEAKRCGEAICCAFSSQGYSARSARVALSYGPGTKLDDHRVINQFIQRAINEGEISLMDMGEAKRTYCYVSDTVEILWNILLYGVAPVYNVGGHSRTTIAELAKSIGKILDVPINFPKLEKNMSDAPLDVSLDMTLVESEFNKNKYVSLGSGLKATIDYQKSLYVTSGEEN
tara:strand:+ start:284 stop:1333 length:1050 start_codon:yes stop_codon:yes gene_type:complete